jgi:hypothetical protein
MRSAEIVRGSVSSSSISQGLGVRTCDGNNATWSRFHCTTGCGKTHLNHVKQCSEFDVRSNFWSVWAGPWLFEEGWSVANVGMDMVRNSEH